MPEDEFEIYLTLLAKTLRLSDDQRRAIASELRDHMEQRLDELTDAGMPRERAIETALAEFGDASALANDLTQHNPARTRNRRHLMQTTFGTLIACAAVTFAVVTLTPTNKDGQPIQPQANAQGNPPATPPSADPATPSMAKLIEQASGITYNNTGKIVIRGDEASDTIGKDIVLEGDLDDYVIQEIWDTIYMSRPYDRWVASGYRELAFYADADSDTPDIILYVNETSTTKNSKNDKRFRCPGLPALIDKIRAEWSNTP